MSCSFHRKKAGTIPTAPQKEVHQYPNPNTGHLQSLLCRTQPLGRWPFSKAQENLPTLVEVYRHPKTQIKATHAGYVEHNLWEACFIVFVLPVLMGEDCEKITEHTGSFSFLLWVPRDQTRVSGKRYLTGPKLASLEDTH